MIRRLLASVAALALLAGAPHAAAQTVGGHGNAQPGTHGPPVCLPNQVCTAEITPPGGGGDSSPPTITFTPATGTSIYASPFTVTVGYCDGTTLNTTSVRDTFNNAPVGPSYQSSSKAGCGSYGVSTLTLTPVAGSNTLVARICDTSANCTRATATYTYVAADQLAPVVTITPASGAVPSATPFVGVTYCDERKIGTVHGITLNGTDITSSLNFTPYSGCSSGVNGMQTFGSVQLRSGTNTLVATVQDSAGNTGSATATWTYTPRLDTSPTNQTSLLPQYSDATLSYSMPAYRSLDQDRGVTLVYSSLTARPFITVQLDVTDDGSTPAPVTSFHVARNGATWPLPDGRTTDMFYQSGQGGNRLTAVYGATNMRSGSYDLTAVVTRWMSGGGTEQLTAPVRALVLNESSSEFGAGWSVEGLRRVILGGDGGVLLLRGGGAAAFYPGYTSCDAAKVCAFGHSPGDFGTLAYDSANAVYVHTARDGARAFFNALGYLTRVQDRRGNAQTYAYDASNRLVSITDPVGLVTTFAYDINGKISTITDPTGRVSVFTVNAAGDLVSIRDPDGVTAMQMGYGAQRAHRVDWYSDRAGRRSDVTYDVFGRVATMQSPSFSAEGSTFRLSSGVVSVEAAAEGTYTGGTSATSPLPRVNPATLRVQTSDPQGRVTRFALDAWGTPSRVETPRGYVNTTTRNAEGRVTSEVDPKGNQTTYSWTNGNLTQVQTPAGAVYYTYDAWGHVTGVTGDVPVVKNWYNATTGALDSTATANDTTRYTYDSLGRLLTVTDPEHHVSTLAYADTSRFRNLQSVTTGVRVARYTYDAYGRKVTVTAADGRVTRYAYDLLNRSTTVTTPDQGQTTFTWGPVFLDQVTDPRGKVYGWTRNTLGQVEREARPGDPTNNNLRFAYDRYGRTITAYNRRGGRIDFTYDALDRIATRSADGQTTAFGYSPDDPANPGAITWKSVSNPESTDTVWTDAKGRMVKSVTVRTIAGAAQRYVVEPHYDSYDRVSGVGLSTPAGRDSVGYNYSPTTFMITSMRDLAGGSTTFGYNHDGMLSSVTLPGGTVSTRSYTTAHMPGGVRYSSNLGLDAAAGVVYEYDQLNRLIERRNPASDSLREFAYDQNGRWLSAYTDYGQSGSTHPTCSFDPDVGYICDEPQTIWTVKRTDGFAYDLGGNPTDHGAAVGAGNRLTQYNGYTLGYDDDGNLVSKTGPGLSQSFTWNTLGQLASVNTNGVVTSYYYNGLGQRVRRTLNLQDMQYLYAGSNLLMEVNASGIQARYSYYPGSSLPHSVTRGGSTYYYGSDAQGSVLALFNGTGTVVNRYSYLPFGEAQQVSENASVPNRIRWAGREFEAETGLYYNNARWYDPSLHRFISEDPIGSAGGINAYAYAMNDPVNFSDPSGLSVDPPVCILFINYYTSSWQYSCSVLGSGEVEIRGWGELGGRGSGVEFEDIREKTHPTSDPHARSNSDIIMQSLADKARYLSPRLEGLAVAGLAAPLAIIGAAELGGPAAIRVFWSGEGTQAAAEAWAAENGGITLGRTATGRILSALDKVVPRNLMEPLWDAASRSFAAGAEGPVQVFQNGVQGVRIASTWARVEFPTLLQNPNITSIIYNVIP